MKVKLLGAHILESKDTKSICLLIDGKLAIDAGGLTGSLSFHEQAKIEAVLLTHQHWDHVRDVISLAVYNQTIGDDIDVYSIPDVEQFFTAHFPCEKFITTPPENPTLKFTTFEPLENLEVAGYSILPVPVNHRVPGVGYQVSSPFPEKGKIFYTGDTGKGLTECWKQVTPELLFIEASFPNRMEGKAEEVGHLTPNQIKRELEVFREIQGYMPQVCVLHFHPAYKGEIQSEIAVISKELAHPITIGYEGLEFQL